MWRRRSTCFRSLCRVGSAANPHFASQVEKLDQALHEGTMDLKALLTGGGKEQTIEQVAADRGLDKQVLSFLLWSSTRPSIEAGREQLRGDARSGNVERDPLPGLRLPAHTQPVEGRWGDAVFPLLLLQLSMEDRSVVLFRLRQQGAGGPALFLRREEKMPAVSISAMPVITISRRSTTETLKNPILPWKTWRPSTSMSLPSKRGIEDLSPIPGLPEERDSDQG